MVLEIRDTLISGCEQYWITLSGDRTSLKPRQGQMVYQNLRNFQQKESTWKFFPIQNYKKDSGGW